MIALPLHEYQQSNEVIQDPCPARHFRGGIRSGFADTQVKADVPSRLNGNFPFSGAALCQNKCSALRCFFCPTPLTKRTEPTGEIPLSERLRHHVQSIIRITRSTNLASALGAREAQPRVISLVSVYQDIFRGNVPQMRSVQAICRRKRCRTHSDRKRFSRAIRRSECSATQWWHLPVTADTKHESAISDPGTKIASSSLDLSLNLPAEPGTPSILACDVVIQYREASLSSSNVRHAWPRFETHYPLNLWIL